MNARIAASLVHLTPAPARSVASRSASALQEPPPWRTEAPDAAAAVRKILAGASFVQPRDGRATDESKIFTAYESLSRLQALATAVRDGDIPRGLLPQARKKFANGLSDLREFLAANSLEKIVLLPSEKRDAAQTEVAISRTSYRYVTPPVHSGSPDEAVPAFATATTGFRIDVARTNDTVSIDIDLSTLAPEARSIRAVAALIDAALDAAGVATGITAVKTGPLDDAGFPTGSDWGFAITGVQTEAISFTATGESAPSLYLAGTSGSGDSAAAQLSQWHSLDGIAPSSAFTKQVEADSGALVALKTAIGADGGVYTLARASGGLDGQSPRGEADLVLIRSDSTGKRIWSRFVGASGPIEGTALAVADDGRVAIGGVVTGTIGDATIGGGRDGFVIAYDSSGRETFARQRGVYGHDAVTALAFGADGQLHVGGRTATPLDGSASAGGDADAYIETLDADGARQWIRHIGTAGLDTVTALTTDESGGVIAAVQESGHIVLRRFAGSEDHELDFAHDLGEGRADAVVRDGTALYVAGQTSASGRADGQFAGASLSASDAFALRIDLTRELVEVAPSPEEEESPAPDAVDDASDVPDETPVDETPADETPADETPADETPADETPADGTPSDETPVDETPVDPPPPELVPTGPFVPVEAWFRRIGGDGTQTAPAIVVSGEQVYLAGSTPGDEAGSSDSYLKGLGAADGADIWTQSIKDRGGISQASDLAVDVHGDSDLARLGLPRGDLVLGDTERITDRTPARPGDHFYISIDGGKKSKIVIERGDTYRDLTFKINAATVLDASAKVVTQDGARTLAITPAASVRLELFAGRGDADALSALGLPEGRVYGAVSASGDSSAAAPDIFALDLRFDIDVADEGALSMLETAQRRLRTAHRAATEDPALAHLNADRPRPGPPPAYLRAQLSNYQAGLLRLQSVASSSGFQSGVLF